MTDEHMKGYQDGMAVAQDVAESLLAQASSEKAALMRHIDKLEAVVDRLQEENQSIGMAAYELGRNSMADENERLRKLVRMAWKCAHSGPSCSDCRMVAGGCTLQSAMRELGVDDD